MAMQTDVKSTRLTASGDVFIDRCRLKSMYLFGGATAGTVQFKDGGASGTILCEVDVPAITVGPVYILVPNEGVLFRSSIYAAFTGGVAAVTAFYG
jgi:hypothetical protein